MQVELSVYEISLVINSLRKADVPLNVQKDVFDLREKLQKLLIRA